MVLSQSRFHQNWLCGFSSFQIYLFPTFNVNTPAICNNSILRWKIRFCPVLHELCLFTFTSSSFFQCICVRWWLLFFLGYSPIPIFVWDKNKFFIFFAFRVFFLCSFDCFRFISFRYCYILMRISFLTTIKLREVQGKKIKSFKENRVILIISISSSPIVQS